MKSNILLDFMFKNSPGCPRGVLGVMAPSVSESPWVSVKRNPRPSRALTIFAPNRPNTPHSRCGLLPDEILRREAAVSWPQSLFTKESQHHLPGNPTPTTPASSSSLYLPTSFCIPPDCGFVHDFTVKGGCSVRVRGWVNLQEKLTQKPVLGTISISCFIMYIFPPIKRFPLPFTYMQPLQNLAQMLFYYRHLMYKSIHFRKRKKHPGIRNTQIPICKIQNLQ